MTREFAQNQIAILMGGRVAEEIVFHHKTTGAGNDIERATELARSMVTEWGMSDEFGPLNFSGGKQEVFLGRDFNSGTTQSEDTSSRIDAEIRRIVIEQYERATGILNEQRKWLEMVAEALLEYETIDGPDIDRMLRGDKLERPLPAATIKKRAAADAANAKADDVDNERKRGAGLLPPIVPPEPAT